MCIMFGRWWIPIWANRSAIQTAPKHCLSITLLQKTGEGPTTIYSKNIQTQRTETVPASLAGYIYLNGYWLHVLVKLHRHMWVGSMSTLHLKLRERKKTLLPFRLPTVSVFIVLVSLYVILCMNHTLNMSHILDAFVNFAPVFSARYVQRQKKELSIKHIIQQSRTRRWHSNEINAWFAVTMNNQWKRLWSHTIITAAHPVTLHWAHSLWYTCWGRRKSYKSWTTKRWWKKHVVVQILFIWACG